MQPSNHAGPVDWTRIATAHCLDLVFCKPHLISMTGFFSTRLSSCACSHFLPDGVDSFVILLLLDKLSQFFKS